MVHQTVAAVDGAAWWKRWSSFRRFFFDDPLMAREADIAAEVRMPVAAVAALHRVDGRAFAAGQQRGRRREECNRGPHG